MILKFSKYQGAGNDFVLIDNRKNKIQLSEKQIKNLCHRRFGVGADGLMLLETDQTTNFKMKYYNSDGKEGTMCGNGGRCIVAFAKEIGIIQKHYHFTAIDGSHEAILKDSEVNLKMSDVNDIKQFESDWFLDTGSPHAVEVVKNISEVKVASEGKKLRYDQRFGTEGTNVNFIEINNNKLKIRTYERGVEAETYACGTGAVASAIIANQIDTSQNKFILEALGGTLEVSFDRNNNSYTNIWLKGPAVKVFSGEILID